MEKDIYVIPQIWLLFGMPTISFLATILLLILQEWYPALACFILCLIFILPLIIWRKLFFSKIKITSDGISRIYKNEVIKKIPWENLVEVRVVPKYSIYFLDEAYDKNKTLLQYRTNITFYLTKKNIEYLLSYKEKFKSKITDISLLSEKYKNLLYK